MDEQLAALERLAVDDFVLVVCTACGLEQSVAVDVPCVVCGCEVAVTSPHHAAAVALLQTGTGQLLGVANAGTTRFF